MPGAWQVGRRLLNVAFVATACVMWGGGACNPGGSKRTQGLALAVDAVESYDPLSDSWQTHASFAPTHYVGLTAAVGSQLVAVAGISTEVSGYDPVNDVWASLAPFPGPDRYGARGYAVQGLLVVLGGYDGLGATSRVDVYDPLADQWRTGADMPAALRETSRFAVAAGRLHVLAEAYASPGGPAPVAEHAAYDPLLDRWELLPQQPNPRYAGTWTSDGTQLYLIGGQLSYDHAGMVAMDRYDPTTRSWSAGPDLALVEAKPVALPIGAGDLLLVGRRGAQRLGLTGWRLVPSPQALEVEGPGVRIGNSLYAYERFSDTQGRPLSFDLTQEVWRRHPDPPTNRVAPTLFVHQSRLYVVLGWQNVRLRPRLP